jgi:hypothetical protein
MSVLWLFATGCACPTFAEMEIVDGDGTTPDERLATARATLDDFAAWTGVAGVCVPGVELHEDLREPRSVPDGDELAGRYLGPRKAILIDHDINDVEEDLRHALDDERGYSAMSADLFSGGAPEGTRRGYIAEENFAYACENRPEDVELDRLIADTCGTERLYDEGAHFLAGVVYPHAPHLRIDPEPVAYQVTERSWAGVDPGADLQDAVAFDGRLYVLWSVVDADSGWMELWLSTFEDDLDAPVAELQLTSNSRLSTGEFARSNAGVYAYVTVYGWDATDPSDAMTHWLAVAAGGDSVAPQMARRLGGTDGLVYVDQLVYGLNSWWSVDAGLLIGEPWSLDLPLELDGDTAAPLAIWPQDDGLGALFDGLWATWSPADETWTTSPGPRAATQRAAIDGDRQLVLAPWGGDRLLVRTDDGGDGTWAVAGDLCDTDAAALWRDRRLATIDGRIIAVATDLVDGLPGADRTLVEVVIGE